MHSHHARFRTLPVAGLLMVALLAARAAEAPKPAEAAWKELRQAATPPSPPKEWSFARPSDEELTAFNKERAAKALAAADQAKDYHSRFPEDSHAQEARVLEYHLLTAAVQLGELTVTDRMQALQERLMNDPGIDEEERLEMALTAARNALQGAGSDPIPALQKATKSFLKAFELFPNRAEPAAYLIQLAEMLLIYDQADTARDIASRLDRDGTDEDIRKAAKDQLAKFDRLGKPVEISFADLEGRQIKLADYHGKVVLIDYWATWCGPCLAGLPELLETYAKWQPKGFEILGISLDSDEDALRKMVREREMKWPQFFDRENEGNRYADRYGITGIPTLWLIDKKGNLRYLNARHDMEAKIARLMAEE